jgi:hypothetical protein
MASKLENLPDKVLHRLINPLLGGYNSSIGYVRDLLDDSDSQRELLEDKFKPTGLMGDIFEDADFIAALCKNNWEVIKSTEPLSKPLKRPKYGDYEVEVSVSLSKHVTEWWKFSLESYSRENCEMISNTRMSTGELDYWDGDLTDSDTHDSDTHDVSIYSVIPISESKSKKPLVEGVSNIIESKSLDDLFKMRHLIEEEILLRLKK